MAPVYSESCEFSSASNLTVSFTPRDKVCTMMAGTARPNQATSGPPLIYKQLFQKITIAIQALVEVFDTIGRKDNQITSQSMKSPGKKRSY